MLVWKFVKETELLSLSVNSVGDYASVGLISSSNKYMIHSLGLNSSNTSQRQQIDLQLPSTHDKKAHGCPIQWGRHLDTEELLAVGANQKLELWNFERSVPQPLSLTQGHLLAIRDINWSVNPTLLGSCSYDSSVLIWDIRDNTQPSVRIKTLAGASSIRFSKEREETLALAHEDIVTIWDIRSVNRYLTFLDLPAKVLDLDWHPKAPQVLSTASKDGFIRVWNYEAQNEPLPLAEKCNKQNGVSRVKFTPCGRGLVSCSTIMTQKSPSIAVWRLRGDPSAGKCQVENAGFVGSSNEQVVGMEWAQEGEGYRLCTISKSKEMRLYDVDPRSFSNIENPEGKALGKKRQAVGGGDRGDIFRDSEGYEPTSLQEEVDFIKKYVSQNERMEFQQVGDRHYSVKLRSSDGKNVVQCRICLPPLYPRACEPNFEIYTSLGLVEVSVKSELIQTLTSTAAHYVSHNRFCLRYCVDTLYSSFQKLSLESSNEGLYQDLNELYTHTKISPPLMGAKFGANNSLVIFGLVKSVVKAPRTLTDFTQRLTPRDTWGKSPRTRKGSHYSQESVVKICDLSSLSRLDYNLARDSIFYDCDPGIACYHNRMLSATHTRSDLVQVWHLLLHLVTIKPEHYSMHFQFMANEVVSRALECYLRTRDVQAVAHLSCFIYNHNQRVEKKLRLQIADNLMAQIDHYKTIYSEVLTRWELLNSKCKVMKCIKKEGGRDGRGRGSIKTNLKRLTLCVVCHCPASGLVTACPLCNHGGHLQHLKEWLSTHEECPTGCGCKCGEKLS